MTDPPETVALSRSGKKIKFLQAWEMHSLFIKRQLKCTGEHKTTRFCTELLILCTSLHVFTIAILQA